MRTTLTIDDDILAIAKERARHEGHNAGPAEPLRLTERNGLPVLASRGTTVTNDLVDQLREEEGVLASSAS